MACRRYSTPQNVHKASLSCVAEPSRNGHAAADEDMEIEEGEALPPPPPPPAPGADMGADMGPSRPPADCDAAAAYADPEAYEAYMQSSVAYQARTQPLQIFSSVLGS